MSPSTLLFTLAAFVTPMVAAAQPFAYTTDGHANTITVIDTARMVVTDVIGVRDNPYGIAVRPDGSAVYVTNRSDNAVSILYPGRTRIPTTVVVGEGPVAVAIHPDGSAVYVANSGDETVSVIDTSDDRVFDRVVATVRVGPSPTGIVVHPDGSRVYVANRVDGSISVIDTTSLEVVDTIPVGSAFPFGLAVHPAGTRLYVTCHGNDDLRVIDLATHAVTGIVRFPRQRRGGPTGVAVHPDGTRVYVADAPTSRLSVIDTTTLEPITSILVGAGLTGVSLDATGSRVYVASFGATSLTEIDTATNVITRTVLTGAYPIAFGSFVEGRAASPCTAGSVNRGIGYTTDVLTINGSTGDASRVVRMPARSPIDLALAATPVGPSLASYVVWVWRGTAANPSDLVTSGGATIGCVSNPTPFHPGEAPRPFGCLRGGVPARFCDGLREFGAAPYRAPWALRWNRGFSTPATYTLQGVIRDAGATSAAGFSVTNAVTLKVE